MRIAFVLECFPRISETFILDQITGLLDLGHDVVLLSLWKPDEAIPLHRDIERYDLLSKTEYADYTPGEFRGRMKRARYFASRFPRALLTWMKSRRSPDALKLPLRCLFGRHIQKLYPLLGRSVDLIYCHFGTTAREFLFLRKALRIPFAAAFWGYDVELLPEIKPDVYDEVFDALDLFLAPSRYLAGKLIDLGCPEDRLVVQKIGLKLDAANQAPVARTGSPAKLLSVGRLVEEKGYAISIPAVARLDCDFEYSIIGDGPERDALRRLIAELGLEHRVKLLGAQCREDVFQAMAESDLYLCPSLRESFGVANLEASFSQLPIVASNVGGIPEVVQDGTAGLLVPPGDVEALSIAIGTLIADTGLRIRMGEAGMRYVRDNFDHRSLMRHLEQQLLRVI
jgi:colanic acid/amylovoran biosynthesis glycosyltransferase